MPFGLCPGSKQPKDLDSFLIPFLEELEVLHIGVQAYDAHTKSSFLLKAHLVILSGDTPGVSKLLHLTGHVGKRPYRACKIQGISYKFTSIIKKGTRRGQSRENTTQYYPLFPPTNADAARHPSLQSYRIQITNLPRRITENYIHDGEASSNNPACITESGVKDISPFIRRLKTISISESAPFDVMHLVYLVLMRDLCGLMNGKFFKSAALNEQSARMTEKEWIDLGNDMANIRAPVSWGRDPRNIEHYINSFKAEELSNFLGHYLLPLCVDKVDRPTYKALQSLVLAISIATSYDLYHHEIQEVEDHIVRFVK